MASYNIGPTLSTGSVSKSVGTSVSTSAPLTVAPKIQQTAYPSLAPVAAPTAYPSLTPKAQSGTQGQSTQGPMIPLVPTSGGPAVPTVPIESGGAPAAPTPFQDSPFVPPISSGPVLPPVAAPGLPIPDDSQHWNDPGPAAVVAKAPSTAVSVADSTAQSLTAATSTALATVPKAPEPPSLWRRILIFFHILKPDAPSTVHGEPMTIERAAVSLVRRANNGDQNAMGLLVMIRENAMAGNATAQKTYQLMRRYIDETSRATHAGEPSRLQPYNMGGEPSRLQPYNMGHERINRGWAKAVYLANGPTLGNEKIADVTAHFGAEGKAFLSGVLLPTYPAVSKAHHHGKVVGMARKIQAVRMPNSRISDYSPTVGWELGE